MPLTRREDLDFDAAHFSQKCSKITEDGVPAPAFDPPQNICQAFPPSPCSTSYNNLLEWGLNDGSGARCDLMRGNRTRQKHGMRTFIFSGRVYVDRVQRRRVAALSESSPALAEIEGLGPQYLPDFYLFFFYFTGNPCLLKRPRLGYNGPIKACHAALSPRFLPPPSPRCVAAGLRLFKTSLQNVPLSGEG